MFGTYCPDIGLVKGLTGAENGCTLRVQRNGTAGAEAAPKSHEGKAAMSTSMCRVPLPAYWQQWTLYRTTRAYQLDVALARYRAQDAERASRIERDALPPRAFPQTDPAHDNDVYRAIRSARLAAVDAAINAGEPRTEFVVPEWRDSSWKVRDDPKTDNTVRFEFRAARNATGTVKHVFRRGRFIGSIRRTPDGWISDAAPGVVVKDRLELAYSLLALKRGATMPALPVQSEPKPRQAPPAIKPRGTVMTAERFSRHVTAYPGFPKFGADS